MLTSLDRQKMSFYIQKTVFFSCFFGIKNKGEPTFTFVLALILNLIFFKQLNIDVLQNPLILRFSLARQLLLYP